MSAPLLDAFGTRLDPDALRAGLARFNVPGLALYVYDHEVVLEVAGADPGGDAVSQAVTWVRGCFSPLMPCRVFPVDALDTAVSLHDRRDRTPHALVFAEVTHPDADLTPVLDGLLSRLDPPAGPRAAGGPVAPVADDPTLAGRLTALAVAWGAAVTRAGGRGAEGTLAWLSWGPKGAGVAGGGAGAGPHLVAWERPGGATGVRPATILAATWEPAALRWLQAALQDPPEALPDTPVLLDGLVWGVARRPTVAAPPRAGDTAQIRVDPGRCTSCGLCAAVCPTGYLDGSGRPTTDDPAGCIRCYDCVEACPVDALRPVEADDTASRSDLPGFSEGLLARLRGAPGPAEPAPFPPSWLLPRAADAPPPRVVLGLAVMTQQEHAAALVIDGKLVGAVEEEKLVRVRHYGWTPRRGPRFRNLGVDPTLTLEAVLCRRSVRALLDEAGLTLDDVDLIALNGLPSRYRRALPVLDAAAPIPTLRAGRLIAVPHHLCHAASAYRLSGLAAAWVLTVDGRGDRETAALFRGEGATLRPHRTVLSLTDRSIGGVYETVTRLLGFGSHGQGSVMALAAFGAPDGRLAPFLSATGWDDVRVHEGGVAEAFTDLAREPSAPLARAHQDLAAALQAALERTLLALARDGVGEGPVDALCLAGGVTLNCRANNLLRVTLRPGAIWAQPGANDAGTAIGAAAEAWAALHGHNLAPMDDPRVGPAFDDDAIEAALRRRGVAFQRVDDVAEEVARRLADGEVVCWFQGRLEFGPRALGGRSILADPRHPTTQDRVNAIKTREPWRPFGPSVLAGHEGDWFETAFDSRFMLFTIPVAEARRQDVPAIVHVDGSSRPQVVHADTQPLYHRMLTAFHARTGVPMVVNTSFNRRGEPIVATPDDALDSFAGLGADTLAIGPFLVARGARAPAPEAWPARRDGELAGLPGGRRLMLRTTTVCDLDCAHCTLRDHVGFGVASADAEALARALADGRRAGCDELVLMRGEASRHGDPAGLIRRARRMGYRYVQLQTHGRALASPDVAAGLREAGLDAIEVMLLGADAALHDRLAGAEGAFRDTVAGLQAARRVGLDAFVTVPVLRRNALHLPRVALLVSKLGIGRIQFQYPRPVELKDGVPTDALLRLTPAARAVQRVLPYARQLGLVVSTEGFPLCHLDQSLWGTPDATEDFRRHRVDDLGLVWDDFGQVRTRMRPDAPPCRACAVRDRCPRTWALTLELFGSGELRPVS